jgi:hypothetical protein
MKRKYKIGQLIKYNNFNVSLNEHIKGYGIIYGIPTKSYRHYYGLINLTPNKFSKDILILEEELELL